jgi:uncharacterized membrane protein YkoI
MKKTIIFAFVAAAILGAGVTNAALANKKFEDMAEHQAFLISTISLSDAIASAQTQTGARAIAAEFEDEDGTYIYEIELISANGDELEVHIDAITGEILPHEEDNDTEDQ